MIWSPPYSKDAASLVKMKKQPKEGTKDWALMLSRFLSGIKKVENGCWVCVNTDIRENGYRRLVVRKAFDSFLYMSSHRLSYMHFKGAIPDGLLVMHRCDNRECCNPDHLVLGDALANSADMVAKDRSLYGERHPLSKLTEADVLEIHRLSGAGERQSEIAAKFSITQAAVSAIVSGKTWRRLHPNAPKRVTVRRQAIGCTVPGCPMKARKRGMCLRHHRRLTSTGTTEATKSKDAHLTLAKIAMSKLMGGLVKAQNGCWTSTNADTSHSSGYARVRIYRSGKGAFQAFAHRFVYEETKGPIAAGLVVRHRCDNRLCFNPDHLELGTQSQNMGDMVARGRSRTGMRHHNATLSDALVFKIRSLASGGFLTQREIAEMFGIAQPTVSDIVTGRRWRHLFHQTALE